MAANLGVTPADTGEFLLGTVAVTPVFFESNGVIDQQTQNWSAPEIDQVLAKVTEGVHWWSDALDTLNSVHTLDFVIDDTYAVDPVETRYEPIDRSSSAFNDYIGDFVTELGYGESDSIEEAVQKFNHTQRERLQTDWAFTIFVVDSSDDDDGLFASGGFAAAFAFAGGLFMVTPSTRPVSTIAHEMGHIFWARDEYAGGGSWNDRRGYYNTQNLNAVTDNPDPNFQQQISIMRGGVPLSEAYETYVSPASTFAMVGWQDSDGDGVFDLADVPLSLDAVGYFDSDSSLYHFSGIASAVPLMNRNSSGTQSDITLNRISQLQYRLDDGSWQVAAEPDLQRVDFDLALTLDPTFSTIDWRVIDQLTGITSEVVSGSLTLPALSTSSVSGLAFVDENGDGQRDTTEAVLPAVSVRIRNSDGSDLFGGQVDAESFPDGELPGDLSGATLAADGMVLDPQVASFTSDELDNQRVFHAFDRQRDRWVNRWSEKSVFEASFEQTVGRVQLDVIGFAAGSYGRLEAYDAGGEILTRVTSEAIGEGQIETLIVTDPLGRIASIRALGHNQSSIALNDLRFGIEDTITTTDSAALQFENLPDGEYVVEFVPERLIHQFDQATTTVQVSGGTSEFISAPARRINSPRHNESLPEDANGDGLVTSSDALVIVNDLGRLDPRVLQPSETTGLAIDVSNDGVISALDALLVINRIGQSEGGSGELVASPPASVAASVDQNANSDPSDDPSNTFIGRMFSPANRAADDEIEAGSESNGEAQATEGAYRLAAKTPVSNQNTAQTRPETTISAANDAVQTAKTESSLSPIKAEIPEPF